MAQSRLELILEAAKGRLEAISTTGGYSTDAGQAVYLGAVPALGPHDDTAAIALLPGFENLKVVGGFNQFTLVLQIQALVFVPSDERLSDSFLTALAMLADIRKAMELEDRTLGGKLGGNGLEAGLPSLVERETGSQFVGVQMEYRGLVKNDWGNP
jgi:hypothetical protein